MQSWADVNPKLRFVEISECHSGNLCFNITPRRASPARMTVVPFGTDVTYVAYLNGVISISSNSKYYRGYVTESMADDLAGGIGMHLGVSIDGNQAVGTTMEGLE